MTLIPSGVQLALASTKGGGLTPGSLNSSNTFIDCRGWTANLRERYEQPNPWKAPVHYTTAPLAELFSHRNLWPGETSATLQEAQRQLEAYITRCGYQNPNFEAWQAEVDRLYGAPTGYNACPKIDTTCALGT